MFRQYVGAAAGIVAMPVFSKINREGGSVRESYLLATQHATVLAWPFFGLSGLMAFPIVRIMFGDQWDAAVPLIQILSIGGALMAAYLFGGQALLAMGKVRVIFWIELMIQSMRVPLVLFAVFHSIEAVAGIHSFIYLLGAISFNIAVSRSAKFTVWEFIETLLPSVAVTFCALLAPVGVFFLADMSGGNQIIILAIAVIGAAIGWILGIYIFHHPIRHEITVLLKNYPIKLRF